MQALVEADTELELDAFWNDEPIQLIIEYPSKQLYISNMQNNKVDLRTNIFFAIQSLEIDLQSCSRGVGEGLQYNPKLTNSGSLSFRKLNVLQCY